MELKFFETESIVLVPFLLLFEKGCHNKDMPELFGFIRWSMAKLAHVIETLQYNTTIKKTVAKWPTLQQKVPKINYESAMFVFFVINRHVW